MATGYYQSPIGWVEISGSIEAVTSLNFVDQCRRDVVTNACIEEALRQVAAYFQGTRQHFDLPVVFHGTPFQQLVWRELTKIPYGKTVSYKDVAQSLGRPRAVRAVGAANGKNPISIIAACHRVIGSDGNLVGYGGGLWRKKWLLEHEGFPLNRGDRKGDGHAVR